MRRGMIRVAASTVVLLLVISFLHWAARFELAGPGRWSGDQFRIWLEDPVIVLATAARWTALALSYYLLVVVLLLAAATRSARLSRLVPRRVVGPVSALLGIGAVVLPLRFTDGHPLAGSSAPLRPEPVSPGLVLEPVPAPWDVDPVLEPADLDDRSAATIDEEWEGWHVSPGESFWSIACDALVDAWGRRVSEDEIGPYWRRLVEANEDRLVEPTNPDLILPGQQFVLPPVPADPRRSESR